MLRRVLKNRTVCCSLLTALGLSLSASAHHSHAMFDDAKRIAIVGTVMDFEYTNPHSWLKVINDADGSLWSFETNPPSTLLRAGVKRSSLPSGEKVTVNAMPLRDGRPGGQIVNVVKTDGTTIIMAPQGYSGGPTK
ncbi:MAG: DUF6152 family protein [Steroidobacteraceae bacterium]